MRGVMKNVLSTDASKQQTTTLNHQNLAVQPYASASRAEKKMSAKKELGHKGLPLDLVRGSGQHQHMENLVMMNINNMYRPKQLKHMKPCHSRHVIFFQLHSTTT
jgi:hypothetical protein